MHTDSKWFLGDLLSKSSLGAWLRVTCIFLYPDLYTASKPICFHALHAKEACQVVNLAGNPIRDCRFWIILLLLQGRLYSQRLTWI